MKNLTILIALLTVVITFNSCNDSNTGESNSGDKTSTSKPKGSSDACMSVSPGDSIKYISKNVEVKGEVITPLNLTVDSLKQMKVVNIDSFTVVCQSGATMKQDKSCKGVLLKDILEKAVIKQSGHKDRNFYIVARATDNYKATFSWAEIFNNPTGQNTYIIFEENGQPIGTQGDMILICKNDIKTGPRHVYWLKSIEVNRVD
ncbi:MAG: molybdopterin-dependent oxidoreductase [Bacteroidetes bacterium]|nr:molybdopterin-dependent oxidoreductase [Bacteroidota bacterium]